MSFEPTSASAESSQRLRVELWALADLAMEAASTLETRSPGMSAAVDALRKFVREFEYKTQPLLRAAEQPAFDLFRATLVNAEPARMDVPALRALAEQCRSFSHRAQQTWNAVSKRAVLAGLSFDPAAASARLAEFRHHA